MPIAQCVQVLKRQCHVIKSVQAMYSEAVSVLRINYLFIPVNVICVVVYLPQWLNSHGTRTATCICYSYRSQKISNDFSVIADFCLS